MVWLHIIGHPQSLNCYLKVTTAQGKNKCCIFAILTILYTHAIACMNMMYFIMKLCSQLIYCYVWKAQISWFHLLVLFAGNNCDPAWENRAYVHKIHPFIFFCNCLSHLLYKLYKFCKLQWIVATLFTALLVKVSLISYVWSQSYETLKSKKLVKFYVHISPILSCRVTIYDVKTHHPQEGWPYLSISIKCVE